MPTPAVQRIPAEILRGIFRECLPPRRDLELGNQRFEWAVITTPLSISHVCNTWRCVALSYRYLWSNLNIYYSLDQGPRERMMAAEIFYTWLERSNGAPLNFLFYCTAVDASHEGYPVAESMIRRLISEQARWNDVDFIWVISKQFRGSILDNMPLLTRIRLMFSLREDDPESRSARHQTVLYVDGGEQEADAEADDEEEEELTFDDYEEDGTPPDFLVSFTRSPLLKSAELSGNYTFVKNGGLLEDLEFCDFYFDFWLYRTKRTLLATLDFLESTPNLRSLCISLYGDGSRLDSVEREPFALPNLRSLYLRKNIAGSFFVDRITLPALTNLAYEAGMHEGTLYSLILRSNPPLTHLAVSGHGLRMTEDSIIPVLRELPLLQELWISFAVVSSDLFRELTVAYKYFRKSGIGERSMHREWRFANTVGRPRKHMWTSEHTLEMVHDPSFTPIADHVVCPNLQRLRLGYLRFSQDGAVVLSALRDMVKSRVMHLDTLRRVLCYKDTAHYMSLNYEEIPELRHSINEDSILNLHLMILSEGQDSDPDEVFR